jgi:hypothetical protein
MKQNSFGGIKTMALFAAAVLLLSAFSLVASAQRKRGDNRGDVRGSDDNELFKDSRSVQDRNVVSPAPQRGGQGATKLMPGETVRGTETASVVRPPIDVVNAGPVSSCVFNGGTSQTCNIYETDASGNLSEISNVIALPLLTGGGYVIVKHDASIADSDTTNWSDVLKFGDGSAAGTMSMQLFSEGCNTGIANDRSCFPTYAAAVATAAFITENPKPPTVYVAGGPSTYNIYSGEEHRPFTLAASTGTVDEDSTALIQFLNFEATFLPAATGSIHIRYNITAVDGASAFCPATASVVKTRFRNTDNTGAAAKVSYDIHSTSITAGGNNIIYSFSSNARGNGTSFTTATDVPSIDFDFANNVYWIEATIFRSNTTQRADLGSIQIYEFSGTACP